MIKKGRSFRKIFLDTNVWLRFIVADNNEQYKRSRKLIQLIEQGYFKPYASTIVFLEVYYVLTSFYEVGKKEAVRILGKLFKTRGLTILKQTDIRAALNLHSKYKIKLSDCLILTSLPKDVVFITWDKDFKRVKDLICLSPAEMEIGLGVLGD